MKMFFLELLFSSSQTFRLRVLLSFCLMFCQFQPGNACKSLVCKKKACIIFHAKNEAKFLEILKELFNKIKLLGLKLNV